MYGQVAVRFFACDPDFQTVSNHREFAAACIPGLCGKKDAWGIGHGCNRAAQRQDCRNAPARPYFIEGTVQALSYLNCIE